MEKLSCAFTGHRPKSFPWGYNETARDCILLKDVLASQIETLVGKGVTDFLSGMALGMDLWSAQIVLGLKKKNSALNIHCILPCEGQEHKWPEAAQEQYRSILRQADDVIYVEREYSRNCMLKRNRYLVDHSSVLLAIYNGAYRSGTGMTVRYAESKLRRIIMIDPITRAVSDVNGEL